MKQVSSNPSSSTAANAQPGNDQYKSGRLDETLIDDTDDTDISPEEIELLDAAETSNGDGDNAALTARLDNTDEDGELLEEKSMADDVTGEDLDVPGSEDDDYNEELGEEDEENNNYSEADTD